MKETIVDNWKRDFILDEQMLDPTDTAERIRMSARAIRIDQAVRELFTATTPATWLDVRTSYMYTRYETDCASFAVMLHAYLNNTVKPGFLQHVRPVGKNRNHAVITTRLAEFNYILNK